VPLDVQIVFPVGSVFLVSFDHDLVSFVAELGACFLQAFSIALACDLVVRQIGLGIDQVLLYFRLCRPVPAGLTVLRLLHSGRGVVVGLTLAV